MNLLTFSDLVELYAQVFVYEYPYESCGILCSVTCNYSTACYLFFLRVNCLLPWGNYMTVLMETSWSLVNIAFAVIMQVKYINKRKGNIRTFLNSYV